MCMEHLRNFLIKKYFFAALEVLCKKQNQVKTKKWWKGMFSLLRKVSLSHINCHHYWELRETLQICCFFNFCNSHLISLTDFNKHFQHKTVKYFLHKLRLRILSSFQCTTEQSMKLFSMWKSELEFSSWQPNKLHLTKIINFLSFLDESWNFPIGIASKT